MDEGEVSSLPDDAEFTFRAVTAGLGVGLLLCFTNTYFGLQTGWISMMSLQASLIGFAAFKVLPDSRLFSKRSLTVKENIVLQTTAVATGTLPLAAGLVGIIPALAQLDPELDSGAKPIVLSFLQLLIWCFGVAFFGVFLAVPLRQQVIVKEELTFPSGTATAQIISILHGSTSRTLARVNHNEPPVRHVSNHYSLLASHESDVRGNMAQGDANEASSEHQGAIGDEIEHIGRSGWMTLLWSFATSAAFTLLSIAFPIIYAVPIFDLFGHLAHDWLWWFTPSFSYIGQGIIMGFPTTASMNLGMLFGWALLSPLAKKCNWAPGPVSSTVDGARGWILWPALAIMMAESILSVSVVAVGSVFGKKQSHSSVDSNDGGVDASIGPYSPAGEEDRNEPFGFTPAISHLAVSDEDTADTRVVIGGVMVSGMVCVISVSIVFGQEGIRWWATIIALILASVFSVLGVRALGETDLNPVSAIGKISQLIFAIVQPHNVVANLIAGGISEAGAQQAGDLMQDLKTGHLHGASPKAQFYSQLIGSFASAFASSGIYVLYRKVYQLPSSNFPVPTAGIWLNLARLVNNGRLPPRSKEVMVIFGITFVILAGLKTLGQNTVSGRSSRYLKWSSYIPSGIAFAIGFINTPSFSLARLVGGLTSLYVTTQDRKRRQNGVSGPSSHLQNIPLIIVASGFVLGEGLASVVGLAVKSAGGGPISCWGCGLGGGGYCGGC